MFKKLASALILALVAATPALNAEMKIVVLDPVRAILESEEAKVLVDAANKEMAPETDALRAQAEEMQALQERLQKDGQVMSEAESRKVVKEIESMQADLKFGSQKLQRSAQDKRQERLC